MRLPISRPCMSVNAVTIVSIVPAPISWRRSSSVSIPRTLPGPPVRDPEPSRRSAPTCAVSVAGGFTTPSDPPSRPRSCQLSHRARCGLGPTRASSNDRKLALLAPAHRIEAERLGQRLALGLRHGRAAGAVAPDGLLRSAVSPVDLERRRVVLFDVLVGVVGSLEKVRVLVELGPPLVAGLDRHLEDLVEGLVGGGRPDLSLKLALVLRLELHAVLLR